MTDRPAGVRERSPLGREDALWAEIIRCELDSWRPRGLPGRFRPETRRRQRSGWGNLPLVVAACAIVLTIATFGNLTSDFGGVLHHLGGLRPLAVPGSTSGAPPTDHHGQKPAPATGGLASSARTSAAAGSLSPHIARVGTASEPRTTARSPSAQGPAPLPSPPPPPPTLPSISPTPLVVAPFATPAGISPGQPPGVGGNPVPSAGQ